MALDKHVPERLNRGADDEENRRHPPPLSPSGGGQGEDVEACPERKRRNSPMSPALPLNVVIRGQYKAIYCVCITTGSIK